MRAKLGGLLLTIFSVQFFLGCASKVKKTRTPEWTEDRKAYLISLEGDVKPIWEQIKLKRDSKSLRLLVLPKLIAISHHAHLNHDLDIAYIARPALLWCWLPKHLGVNPITLKKASRETEFFSHLLFEHALTLPSAYGNALQAWTQGQKNSDVLFEFLFRPTTSFKDAIEQTILWLYDLKYDPRGLLGFMRNYPERFSILEIEQANLALRKFPPPSQPIVSSIEYERLKKEVSSWAKN